ncbi:MAG TPA: choice-of-anchor D domain-containing protein, partial [Candidatus Kapabacteria bacterium]|nr:choice-of-anchor D domain-containing protein [Candidatus Kapabacteria bacterium]
MDTPKKLLLLIPSALLLLIFTLLPSLASAQLVSAYTMTTFSGTYTTIAGDGSSSVVNVSNKDDGGFSAPLPFNFKYDGTTYSSGTNIFLCSNGFMAVNNSTTNSVPDPVNWGVADNVNNVICPFSCDLYMYGTGGNMYQEISGTSPNRVWTIEWYNYNIYGYFSYYTSLQVKMYESSNTIEFWYKDLSSNFGGANLGPQGQYNDPCTGNVGLVGNPYASDKKMYATATGTIPSSDIRFTGAPDINMDAEPRSYAFGALGTGSSVQTTITVKSVGAISGLLVKSATISGNPDFTVISAPDPADAIASGDTRTITVQFAPQTAGPRNASLTIVSNGRDSGIQYVALTGIGLAPTIAIDTNILFKKKPVKMGQSITGRIIITSTSSPTLTINSFVFSGVDAGQYQIVHYPALTLPGFASDSLIVQYTPTIEGRHSAILTINSNAINSPALQIQLIGTAILPHITVVPNPLIFDSTFEGDTESKQITITNPGSDTLIISPNILTSNDGDFTATLLTGSDTAIPPDHFKTVNVVFKPKQMGTRQARYLLRTNIIPTFEQPRRDTAGTFTVAITGTGVPFGVLAQTIGSAVFDTTIKGMQVCHTDTLKNNGDADLTITSWSVTGTNSADFTASGLTLPYLLKARSSVVINVCSTPGDYGLRTGTLTINGKSNGKSESVNISLNVYGLKVCDQVTPSALFSTGSTPELILENTDSTECVTVTNCGQVASTYTAKLSSSSSPDYTISSPTTSGSIAPNGTASFCVKFHPNSTTVENGTLVITTPDLPPLSVALGGSGACANVSAPAPTVPNTNAGGHGTFNISITNAGNYQW